MADLWIALGSLGGACAIAIIGLWGARRERDTEPAGLRPFLTQATAATLSLTIGGLVSFAFTRSWITAVVTCVFGLAFAASYISHRRGGARASSHAASTTPAASSSRDREK